MTDIVTQYTLTVPDKTNIDGVVPLSVTLGAYRTYSQQSAAAVANAYLSGADVVSVSNDTIDYTSLDYTIYIPNSTGIYVGAFPNGYQHGLISIVPFYTQVESTTYVDYVLEYQRGTGVWTSVFASPLQIMQSNTQWYTVNYGTLFSGSSLVNSDPLRYRLRITAGSGTVRLKTSGLVYGVCIVSVVPRHTHDWTQTGLAVNTVKAVQTDTVTDLVAATPTTISYRVNGSAWVALSCPAPNYTGTVADIKSLLVTGINTIEFKSSTVCSVRPSSSYKVFGVT